MLRRMLRWGTRLPEPLRRLVRDLPGIRRLRDRAVGSPRPDGADRGALRPVVYLPTWSQWDVMRQRQQYLMAAWAEAGHPAFFVDQRIGEPQVHDGVQVVPSLDHVPGRGVILYIHFAPVRALADRFEQPVIVYDILDDLTIYEPDEVRTPPRRRVAAHHPELVAAADVVTVSSPVLADRHRHERPDLLLAVNGVDHARFSEPAARPADLPPVDPSRPLVGYHGALGEWFHFDMVAGVAALLPDYRFVLVGPVYPRVADRAAALDELPNVTLLGERLSSAMPGYVQAFDVGTVFFVVNEMTEAVTPLKMYECFSAGVPCVATPLPACVEEPLVRTAGDPAGFAAALRAAVAEAADPGYAAKAQAAGEQAGWGARLAPVRDRLDRSGLLRMP